jgi:hypothetical protein
MTNEQITDFCKGNRLRIARVLHLGALAGVLINRSDEDVEDLLIDIDTPAGAHVLAALPGLAEGDSDEGTNAFDVVDAATDADKFGFVVQVEQPIQDDKSPAGSWGFYARGWFYGETLADALVAAAAGMPALADRRKPAPSHATGEDFAPYEPDADDLAWAAERVATYRAKEATDGG